jgi:hypothetical protein
MLITRHCSLLQFEIDSWSGSSEADLSSPPHAAGPSSSHDLCSAGCSSSQDLCSVDEPSPVDAEPPAALWGHCVHLKDCEPFAQLSEEELAQRLWGFGLLALSDKTDLPVEHPGSSWEAAGLRIWCDALDRLRGEGSWDASLERMDQALQHLWRDVCAKQEVSTDHILQRILHGPEVDGVAVPLLLLPLLVSPHAAHFISLFIRRQPDGLVTLIVTDSDPISDERLLGDRSPLSYVFDRLTEAKLRAFFASPLGCQVRWGEPAPAESMQQVLESMRLYLGTERQPDEPWSLQQVQWLGSCLPKSLSILLRHEYVQSATTMPAAIRQLYSYKQTKGAISKAVCELMEEIAHTPLPTSWKNTADVVEILAQQVRYRQRYHLLAQGVQELKLAAHQQALTVIHALKVVMALKRQAASTQILRGSKSSLERYLTMQCQQTRTSLSALERILLVLAAEKPEDASAQTVALAILHWGDRVIRPIDDGKPGALPSVPRKQRQCLDLRRRICHTAKRTLGYPRAADNQALKRFFKLLSGEHHGRAPLRSPIGSPIRWASPSSHAEGAACSSSL